MKPQLSIWTIILLVPCFIAAQPSADSLRVKAVALSEEGKLEEANTLLRKIVKEFAAEANWEAWYACQTQLGENLLAEEDYEAAKEVLESALEVSTNLDKNHKELAPFYEALSSTYEGLEDYELSLEYVRKALRINQLHYGRSSAQYLSSGLKIGNLFITTGEPDSAEWYADEALEIGLDIYGAKHIEIARGYLLKGRVYQFRKSYTQAAEYYKTAQAILESKEDPPFLGQLYNSLAIIYMYQNQNEEAITYYLKALEVEKKSGSESTVMTGILNYNLGLNYKLVADFEPAVEYILKAVDIWKKILGEDHSYVGRANSLIGDIRMIQGDYDRALEHFQYALANFKKNLGEDHYLTAQEYYMNALVYNNTEQYDTARFYLQEAIIRTCYTFEDRDTYKNPPLEDIKRKETFLEIITGKIFNFVHHWFRDGGEEKLVAGLEAAELAIATMEAMRQEIGIWTESKIILNELYLHIYRSAMLIAYKLYESNPTAERLAKAYEIAEKNKAITLLEALENAEAKLAADIPDTLLQQEKALIQSIAEQETIIRQAEEEDQQEVAQAQRTLLQDRRSYEELIADFEQDFPKYHQLRYDPSVATPHAISNLLDDETLFVEYLIKDNLAAGEAGTAQLYIFTFTNETTKLTEAFLPEDLREKISQFYQMIQSPALVRLDRRSKFIQLSHELYDYLLAPIADELQQKKKLLIVGEGMLNYLPFEALLPSDEQKEFQDLDFLIKDFEISYHYSGSLYQRSQQNRDASTYQGDLLAFAPVFESPGSAVIASRDYRAEADSTFRALGADGRFEPLALFSNRGQKYR